MATYLDLCRDVAIESGTLAGGVSLSAVEGATGRAAKIANWVRKAWINIQNERADWKWMRRFFEAPLIAGTHCYAPGTLGIIRFAGWDTERVGYSPFSLYDPATGKADETRLNHLSYDAWRDRYARGVHDAGGPIAYAINPSCELCVGPRPDKDYVLSGGYRLAPQELVASSDVPDMPPHLHDIIVYEALRLMGASDEAVTLIQTATTELRRRRFVLHREQLPDISVQSEPMA